MELREKMHDPNFLPSHEEISRAFPYTKEGVDSWKEYCFDKENPVFELLNKEFIKSFGDYLSERVEALGGSEQNPVVILEVGAGNGRLTHFLRQYLDVKLSGKIKMIASDSGEWKLKSNFPVEAIGHEEALKQYNPQIVIFSWMPYQEDYTDDFRATESVEEYLLIGETDGGCCGHEWFTWGNDWSFDEAEDQEKQPPYEAGGFERTYIKEVSENQICRTDDLDSPHHSRTISFKRKR